LTASGRTLAWDHEELLTLPAFNLQWALAQCPLKKRRMHERPPVDPGKPKFE